MIGQFVCWYMFLNLLKFEECLNPIRVISRFIIKSQLIVMDEEMLELRRDLLQSQQWEKQTRVLKCERQGSQFQKNYPKNIFIPIIQYLADLGLQQQYEATVGTREEFEGKNVVSLSLIYQLVTQPWFLKHVNKKLLEANISNKILMNSKIKKKLFHLKVARILLQTKAKDAKEFKKLVSRKANTIALEIQENDELFEHPSSVIYLLTLFLNTIRTFLYPKTALTSKASLDSPESPLSSSCRSHIPHQQNSKEEYKNLTKSIILAFTKIKSSSSFIRELEEKVRECIMERNYEIYQKYDLCEGVPNWEDFLDIVVRRCIECRLEGGKMTNSLLNQWILEFKQRSCQVGVNRVPDLEPKLELPPPIKDFIPIILINPPENI